jgi:hypothetical protein
MVNGVSLVVGGRRELELELEVGCRIRRKGDLQFRVSGFGFQVSGLGFRTLDFRFRVSGFGLTVSGLDFEFKV